MEEDLSQPFLIGFDVLKIPVIENGVPTWEEKFPIEKIEELKKRVGIKKFSSQMMLTPIDTNKGRFDIKKLKFYSSELKVEERNRFLDFSIDGNKVVSCSCWWDPSYGSRGGDGSVISVVFIDEIGRYYLHDVKYLYHSDKDKEEIQSAAEQCRQVGEFLREYHIPAVYVESNGIGKFLPEFLRGELAKMQINSNVVEKTSRISKNLRILDTFDVIISAGYLFVNEKVKNTPWIAEFCDWGVDTKAHDDGLDSVAGAISSQPYKLPVSSVSFSKGRLGFAGKTFRVKTNFDIEF
ncbi:hypothetical protein HDR59_02610 [bacterium]|nr:hypothetical protein [bacterium]